MCESLSACVRACVVVTIDICVYGGGGGGGGGGGVMCACKG